MTFLQVHDIICDEFKNLYVPDENECSMRSVEDTVAGDNDYGDASHAVLVILRVQYLHHLHQWEAQHCHWQNVWKSCNKLI